MKPISPASSFRTLTLLEPTLNSHRLLLARGASTPSSPIPANESFQQWRPYHRQVRRNVHSTPTQRIPVAVPAPATVHESEGYEDVPHESTPTPAASLSCLPLSTVLRTYLITTMSSSPLLLDACFAILGRMVNSPNAILDPDRNPVLGLILKQTFYAQFCAGANKKEVERKMKEIRGLGFEGVILEYALEVLSEGKTTSADSELTKAEIEMWRRGMVQSVEMASPGDFLGVKWSGLGTYALKLLKEAKLPTPEMQAAIDEVCNAAVNKDVALLPSAEEENTRAGYDLWTLSLQKRYNSPSFGRAIMYSTYQCYLKDVPAKIARDLEYAKKEGYIAGVKLVRGAYMNSEPKGTIWESKEGTDACYDAMVDGVLRRKWNSMLRPASQGQTFPSINVMIATHNQASVQKARAIRDEQVRKGEQRVRLGYAQLQGMADEVSCDLVAAGKSLSATLDSPKVYKCMPWGTSSQCLTYLMRRAAENKDAVSRTADTRKAMGSELLRRMKAAFGIA